MKRTNLIAALCALLMAANLPVTAATNGETDCFLREKKETAEETVLDERIAPRRGNGPESIREKKAEKTAEGAGGEKSGSVETETKTEPDSCHGRKNGKTSCPSHEEKGGHRRHSPKERETESAVTTGAETTAYNWYCPHRKDGKAPAIPSEMSFVEKHGGYFLDHAAKEDDKVIYLTFDAGYENGNIEKILDTLKAEQVPGAFFVLENLIKSNTDLVKRMAEEGHTVCNHTMKHRDMSKVTDKAAFGEELAKLEALYKEYIGGEMAKYYRPPEGRFSELNLIHAEELGYKTIFWSFAYADWDNEKQMSREKAIEKILTGTHNGEVILLHPTSATNAEILPELIAQWRGMGYRFGTLDELVSMP